MDVEPDLQEISDELGVNVLAVEYPGYGLLKGSKTPPKEKWSMSLCSRPSADSQEASIEGIDKAAIHALAYVITTRGIPGSQVVLFGRSLGSGTALRLAKYARERFHWSVGGVILQCPYISIKQIVSDYACSVASFLIPTYYDNMSTLRELCTACPAAMESKKFVPLLILHGEQDELIWSYHGHALYEEAKSHGHPAAEAVFAANATHNRWDLHEDIIRPVGKFLGRHLVKLEGRLVHSSGQNACFGPGGSPSTGRRGHQGRAFGSASCVPGRVACFGGGNLMSQLLAAESTDENRRFV